MAWFRLEGRGAIHHKVLAAGNEAYGAWCRAGQWCSTKDASACLSDDIARSIGSTRTWTRLVDVGAAERIPDGYRLSIDGLAHLMPPEWWDKRHVEFVRTRDLCACRYCGSKNAPTIDHVVPRCQGGKDGADNLVVACWSCNLSKSGRTPEQAGMTLLPVGGRS